MPLPAAEAGLPARLTPGRDFGELSFHFITLMGQQTNKHIKKKRRIAYHKRRNARLKAAAKAKK